MVTQAAKKAVFWLLTDFLSLTTSSPKRITSAVTSH